MPNSLNELFIRARIPENIMEVLSMLPKATGQTLYMTVVSTFFACVLGLPLGIWLYNASPDGLNHRILSYNTLSRVVNLLRSFPFIILMIVLMPLSRILIKTSIGPTAVIIPLSIAAAPFAARIVEAALAEVDSGVILAARAMGSTNAQIILKVLLPEALPALTAGLALTMINLIGYSAMAGAIGGEGLGDLAIRYGYYRFRTDVTVGAVVVILLLVEAVQAAGNFASRRLLAGR